MSVVTPVGNAAAVSYLPEERATAKTPWYKQTYALLIALLGKAASVLGSKRASVSLLRRSIKVMPGKAIYHRWLGERLLKNGTRVQAQQELCHALWWDSGNSKNVVALTKSLNRDADKEAIVNYYKALIESRSKDETLLEKGFGLAYLAMKDDAGAKEHLHKYWQKAHPGQKIARVNSYKKAKEDDLISEYLFYQEEHTFDSLRKELLPKTLASNKLSELLHHDWDSRIAALGEPLQGPSKRQLWLSLFDDTLDDKRFQSFFAKLHADKQIDRDKELKSFSRGVAGEDIPRLQHYLARYNIADVEVIVCFRLLEGAFEEERNRAILYGDAKIMGQLRQRLTHAKENEELNCHVDKTVERYRQRLLNLEAGKQALFLGRIFDSKDRGHGIAYLFTKKADGSYSCTVINSGGGLRNHSSKRENGKKKYDPAYTIEDISADTIAKGPFIETIVEATTAKQRYRFISSLYNRLKNHSKGKVSQEHRQYITEQRSGSCALSSLKAALRVLLPENKYKEFTFFAKAESLIKFHELFKEKLASDRKSQRLLAIAVKEYKARESKMKKRISTQQLQTLLKPKQWRQLDEIVREIA